MNKCSVPDLSKRAPVAGSHAILLQILLALLLAPGSRATCKCTVDTNYIWCCMFMNKLCFFVLLELLHGRTDIHCTESWRRLQTTSCNTTWIIIRNIREESDCNNSSTCLWPTQVCVLYAAKIPERSNDDLAAVVFSSLMTRSTASMSYWWSILRQ